MIDFFFIHQVTVRTMTGSGPFGPVLATPVTVSCLLNDSEKVVRNAAGDEVTSTTTLYTGLANASRFTVDSEVDLPGRTTRVVTVNGIDGDALGLPSTLTVSLI